MALPLKELAKVNQIITRIQNGCFDENDIDVLLIRLRPYARTQHVFREVANFVAHADARNQGLAFESITGIVDCIRYFNEYVGAKQPLDLSKSFPAYIYRLFLSQAKLADKIYLKRMFKMSQDTLIKKIKSNFDVDYKAGTCALRKKNGGTELLEALRHVMSFLYSRAAFDILDFHKNLKEILVYEKISFNESQWEDNVDRISLAILCLISNKTFVLAENGRANCKLETENNLRVLSGERKSPMGNTSSEPKIFGNLVINGYATVISENKPPLQIAFPLISTNLNPHEHCSGELFIREYVTEAEGGPGVFEIINLAPEMSLSHEFKLIRTDSTL